MAGTEDHFVKQKKKKSWIQANSACFSSINVEHGSKMMGKKCLKGWVMG